MTINSLKTSPRVLAVYGDDQTELDPVLYASEDIDIYLRFRERMLDALAPQGEMESVQARSVIHLEWDVARYRRLLPHYVSSCEADGLRALLAGFGLAPERIDSLVAAFAASGELGEAGEILAAAGCGRDTVRVKAMALNLADVGRFEALILAKEKRRDSCLRDLLQLQQRRRAAEHARSGKQ